VEHVHVHKGGQAILDTVAATGPRPGWRMERKTDKAPRETRRGSLRNGNPSGSVTVIADMSLLDSANVAVGRVVASEEVRNLPIHLGDVDNIIRLGNGVAFTDEPAKDQPWQPLNTAYAMAGSPSSRNEFTLDGSSTTLP